MLVLALAEAGAQPALARGGGGPPGWTMTLNYYRDRWPKKRCRTRFEQEVRKCFAVTYPPAYPEPMW